MKESFPISELNALLTQAERARCIRRDLREGWSSLSDVPRSLLNVFPRLRLKSGFTLRAYMFRESDNGNGFVYAVPTDAPVRGPEDCARDTQHFLHPPSAPEALPDVMDAIEGDGSPQSYLHASISRGN
jgi:hypothetical protein